MSGAVLFRPFLAGDVVQLALQPSQHVTLGLTRPVRDIEDGRELEAGGPAWTAIGMQGANRGRVLCCAGFTELFPAAPLVAGPSNPTGAGGTGGHAVAWALLAEGLGAAHLAVTRFARQQFDASAYSRIEAVVRASVAAECKWPRLIGMSLAATLRRWGPQGETHLLFEHIKEGASVALPSYPTVERG